MKVFPLFFTPLLAALVSCDTKTNAEADLFVAKEGAQSTPVNEAVRELPMMAYIPAVEAAPFSQVRMVALGRKSLDRRGKTGHFQIASFEPAGDPARQLAFLESLHGHKLAGIIIEPIQPDEKLGAALESFAGNGTPVFILDRAVPGAKSAVVLRDDLETIAEMAAEKTMKLISAWKRAVPGDTRSPSVMLLGRNTPRDNAIRARFSTALISMPEIRIEPDVQCDGSEQHAYTVTSEVLKGGAKPVVVFATSDILALGAWKAFDEQELRGDVAIIGIDGAGGLDGGLREVRDGALTATVRRPYLVDQAYDASVSYFSSKTPLPAEIVGKPELVDRANVAAVLKETNEWMFGGMTGAPARQQPATEE